MSKITHMAGKAIELLKRPRFVKESVRTSAYPGMKELFQGKVVLITGATSGIGFASAWQYLEAGAKVIITGRNRDKLAAALQQLEKVGRDRVKGVLWDISDFQQLHSKLEECIECFGKLDILVNNAGVNKKADGSNFSGWEDVTCEDWDYVMNINLKATYFLIQAVAKCWIAEGEGNKHIVNVLSGSAYKPAIAPYGTSKWGVRGITEGFGKRLAPFGIIVNGIAPGPTATAMGNVSDNSETLKAPNIPAQRMSVVEEIANTIVYLSSDYCNTIVGETVRKDGGYSLTTLGEC
ncbi:MAG: SDR family oxidoreductase [Butyrivibrio sp.]|nr:SDR family oxidoreductase [Acetatifactor muris]MCM1558920.1 SDR family oxidoreductase [Butyrivibrio sp.]